MMKVTLRFSSLFFGLLLWSATAWAQNDICEDAIELTIYDSEAEAIPVEGDTRISSDGSQDNIPVCSANFYRDDVWYKVTFPTVLEDDIYAFRVYFGDEDTDISAFGIALYNSCDADPANVAFYCENEPVFDQGEICRPQPNQTVYIRVWSATGDAVDWELGAGTFRIAVFPKPYDSNFKNSTVLWGNQSGQGDFNGGFNDWTTEGIACNNAPSENALWAWTTSGFPFYYFGGDLGTLEILESIKSRTSCDGSVIFDSGLLNFGPNGNDGVCPWMEHEGSLTSPVINLSENNSTGISVLFNQSMQKFSGGSHFLDYSVDGGQSWTEISINEEKTILSTASTDPFDGYYNEEYRVRLPDAENAENLRIRFRFQGGAYWWVIDDVRIIETECNNTLVNYDWFTTAPWAIVPKDQVYPFPVMADIENVGSCNQSNVSLNNMVSTTGGSVIFDETLDYGVLPADIKDENRLFPQLVTVPAATGSYIGVFNLTQDSVDFETVDNSRSYVFAVGGNEFALEDGATTSIVPGGGNWDAGVTRSWAYGNFFYPVKDVEVESILWGINNPDTMAGQSVSVILYQWTDDNGDDNANFAERKYIGFLDYTITGDEVAGETFNVVLENFNNEGEPIIMQANKGYIAMIEYNAPDATAPVLELLGSDARNFRPLEFAFDSAFAEGIVDHKFWSGMLAIPQDGNLGQVDYGADRFGSASDASLDFVPVIRIVTPLQISTKDELPLDNAITAYPNPATDLVQVKLEFTKPYGDVKLRLIDNLGRVVFYKAMNQIISQHVEALNVSELPSGNYILQVETPDGQRSVPVMIAK